MSDPLTALMHAVQVMNLLKTLIMKTLREREETQTDNEFNNHEEMHTSSELRSPVSEDEDSYDEGGEDEESYDEGGDSGNEVESLSEIEESFLKQIKRNKSAKNRFKKELNDLVIQHSSPTNAFDL